MQFWHTVFIEKAWKEHPRAQRILSRVPHIQQVVVDFYEPYWNQIFKPYRKKNERWNLFLASKRGKKVKEAPRAYGLLGEPHYYYIHSFNCIYECEYCYLQGYFKNPDLVLFLNHEEILQEMEEILESHPKIPVWFHGGEFSDSLALSSVLNELPLYHQFFQRHPRALWELRTKSVAIQNLLSLKPLPNLFVTFSLSPAEVAARFDKKTPSVNLRIQAIQQLQKNGFQVGIHMDPIVADLGWREKYRGLVETLSNKVELIKISYISLGVVRFTPEVFHAVERNYQDSELWRSVIKEPGDSFYRYPAEKREKIFTFIEGLLVENGVSSERIYRCME